MGKWLVYLAIPGQCMALVYHARLGYILFCVAPVWFELALHASALLGAAWAWWGLWNMLHLKKNGFKAYLFGRILVWLAHVILVLTQFGLKTGTSYALLWFMVWAIFPILIFFFYYLRLKKTT